MCNNYQVMYHTIAPIQKYINDMKMSSDLTEKIRKNFIGNNQCLIQSFPRCSEKEIGKS